MGETWGTWPAGDLAAAIRRRDLSAVELLDHYVERIDRLNPALNAIVTFDLDRARAAAQAADLVTARGGEVGPLHGLPITVKDALEVAGLRCTGGAVELTDNVATTDAPVVDRVKRAGAIVLGKTNLPRWSADAQASNEIFGTTNNPWDLSRGPGGSSGGSAAAVSAGLSAFDIGTDIGGSLRFPAHVSGIYSHKPSFGVVPALGYLDHMGAGFTEPDINAVGPLARSADDLEMLLDVMAGPTDERAVAWRLELPPPRAGSLGEYRMAAWLDDPACPVGASVAGVLDAAVGALEAAGARIDRTARPDVPLEAVRQIGVPLIAAATALARSEAELADMEAALVDFPDDLSLAARARGTSLLHRDWARLGEERERVRRAWRHFFVDVDVLLCPVSITPAFPHVPPGSLYGRRAAVDVDGEARSYSDLSSWTSFIGFAHLPATVAPAGLTANGLPVGIQIVAPFLEDRTSIDVARRMADVVGGYEVPPLAR
jgi:amidase